MQQPSDTSVNKEKMTQWVHEYTGTLYSWALEKTGRKELAEDIVQDTFIAAFERIDTFRNESSPKTWLISILKNKIADHYRKAYRDGAGNAREEETRFLSRYFNETGEWLPNEAPGVWPDDKHLLDDHDFQHALNKCLSLLPKKWLYVVQLKFLEQKTADEICRSLEFATTNYWQIVHRAKLQLRKCIEVKWFKN